MFKKILSGNNVLNIKSNTKGRQGKVYDHDEGVHQGNEDSAQSFRKATGKTGMKMPAHC
jgi:hypothetical protein